MESWEVAARVEIQDTISQYAHAGDRLRLEEVAATFLADGVLEIRDGAVLRGRQAIVDFLGEVASNSDGGRGAARTVMRHHVASVRFVTVAPDSAQVESYFAAYTEIGLDHFGRYRDAFARVSEQWLIEHRYVSVDWTAPSSRFAGR